MSDESNQVGTRTSEKPERLGFFSLYGGQALWFPVLALTALGLLFVYSASSVYAGQKYGDEYLFFKKQLMFLVPALVCAFLGMRIKISFFDRYAGRLFLGALVMTFLTKAPYIGKKVLGASRWIQIGGFQIQPSEFLKVAAVIFASYLLAKHPRRVLHLWPIGVAFVALLLQPDFGSTMILVSGLTAMIFLHGIPIRFFTTGALLALPALTGIMIAAPYRVKRLVTFLDPFADPLGSGFQIIQSFVAIANGGLFGKGLGGSQQKLFFLPEAHTDFILAVIAEEMGFAGVVVVAAIYALLFIAMIQLIKRVSSHRERLLGTAIFTMLAASTIVNMGVVAGLLPTKGLPLPFVSSGGSSLLASFFMMGILSQIHRNAVLGGSEGKADSADKATNTKLQHLPNLKVHPDV
jgi:cell division protein FtsW